MNEKMSFTSDILLDGLPGYVESISFSSKRNAFWIAITHGRNSVFDLMHQLPYFKKLVSKLYSIAFLRPIWQYFVRNFVKPPLQFASVLLVDEKGRVVHGFHDEKGSNLFGLSSAVESDTFDTLCFGTEQNYVALFNIPKVSSMAYHHNIRNKSFEDRKFD